MTTPGRFMAAGERDCPLWIGWGIMAHYESGYGGKTILGLPFSSESIEAPPVRLDPAAPVPLYYQLKEIVKGLIREGRLTEGQELPSERALVQRYGVSRATAAKALDELVREGVAVKRQGKGTFITGPKLSLNLDFTRQLAEQGMKPGSRLVFVGEETNIPIRLAHMLRLAWPYRAYVISRVRLADDEPILLDTVYFLPELAPAFLDKPLEGLFLFRHLEEVTGLRLTRVVSSVEAALIGEREAHLLGTGKNAPALLVERLVYSGDRPVGIIRRLTRGDRCQYVFVSNADDERDLTLHVLPSSP